MYTLTNFKRFFQSVLDLNVQVYSQCKIVAESLVDYLSRHPNFVEKGQAKILTTENISKVSEAATRLLAKTTEFTSA